MIEHKNAFYDTYSFIFDLPFPLRKKKNLFDALVRGEPWAWRVIGITVNAVCPGYIETEALAVMDGASRKLAMQSVPMRRFGRPEEVAAAIRFLACPEAGYITGSALKIDGGIF